MDQKEQVNILIHHPKNHPWSEAQMSQEPVTHKKNKEFKEKYLSSCFDETYDLMVGFACGSLFFMVNRTSDRLEEPAKNLQVFNAVKLNDYATLIDSVTGEQINQAVANLLKTRPTLVAEGGLANRLPTYDQVLNQLK